MDTKITEQKKVVFFALLCSLTYMVGYLNRQNYSAVMVDMITTEGYAKTTASLALTGLFFSYGIGQIISGYLGDHISPTVLVGGGILTSAAMNLLIPFCPNAVAMTVVWCVNGMAQAMLWPPMVKMMSVLYTPVDYARKVAWISYFGHVGTIIVYLLSMVLVRMSGWRAIFFFSAAAGIIMGAIWFWGLRRVGTWVHIDWFGQEQGAGASVPVKKKPLSRNAVIVLVVVGIAIVLQGIIRDGVHSWMPTFFAETFHVESGSAILSGVLTPLMAIGCVELATQLEYKVFHDEIPAAICCYAVMAVASGIIWLTGSASPVLSLLLLALSGGAASGANMILIAHVPSHFRNTGYISTIAGVLNACTYVGSIIATYGIAAMTERSGSWSSALMIWTLSGAGGVLLCLGIHGRWKRFLKKENETA